MRTLAITKWASVFLAASLLFGCGQGPHTISPSSPVAVKETQSAAPLAVAGPDPTPAPNPVTTASQPPPPVPATFDVADLAEKTKPLVVNITTVHEVQGIRVDGADPFEFFFGPRGVPREAIRKQTALGTGFVIDPDGYVVTNEHVVREADSVRVRLADEREFDASVVGRDSKLDLALLKLQGASNLPAAPLGSSEQLRVGEHVLAVGNPFGLGHTVTLGIVSAKARSIGAGPYDDFIQTDASINPGNSGGPLFNWRGEVVGINTAIRAGANGIGFATPVDALKDVLPQLRSKGFVERGKLGILFQPLSNELAKAMGLDSTKGALVSEVEPSGAAARAGIQSGDVIMAVNGTPIAHGEDLPRNVARNPPGSEIKVSLVRKGQPREVTARLDLMPDDDAQRPARTRAPKDAVRSTDQFGIQVSDVPGVGVRVDQVSGDSKELLPGDVIVEVNGTRVKNVQELKAVASKAKPGSSVLAKVRRGQITRFAAVPIPAKK